MSRLTGLGPSQRPATSADSQVGSRLRARRRRAGLSRQELADALGTNVRQLRDYEDGTVRVSAAMLARAATVLGSTVLEFFGDVGMVGHGAGTDEHTPRHRPPLPLSGGPGRA
ncbi:helix-turn-helix transcriptional regulator [Phenylobacterium sp. SCN 70-31]|uniref:helix-turn-helix domain-containing protein n=1 Tax=Phenylobacterium sp. SCN 70-31 TaxID=1660129 RepID=UPI003431DC87